MGSTIAHELGHYFGLNHPTESDAGTHDVVYDTPRCSETQRINGTDYITIDSCRSVSASPARGTANPAFFPTGVKCGTACDSAVTAAQGVASSYSQSLGRYCPAVQECQFNHVMWWTSKNFNSANGDGDGNIFSTDSGKIIKYNSFIQ